MSRAFALMWVFCFYASDRAYIARSRPEEAHIVFFFASSFARSCSLVLSLAIGDRRDRSRLPQCVVRGQRPRSRSHVPAAIACDPHSFLPSATPSPASRETQQTGVWGLFLASWPPLVHAHAPASFLLPSPCCFAANEAFACSPRLLACSPARSQAFSPNTRRRRCAPAFAAVPSFASFLPRLPISLSPNRAVLSGSGFPRPLVLAACAPLPLLCSPVLLVSTLPPRVAHGSCEGAEAEGKGKGAEEGACPAAVIY